MEKAESQAMPYQRTVEEVLAEFNADAGQGLSEPDARARLEEEILERPAVLLLRLDAEVRAAALVRHPLHRLGQRIGHRLQDFAAAARAGGEERRARESAARSASSRSLRRSHNDLRDTIQQVNRTSNAASGQGTR